MDALAALAENDGVLKAGSAGTVETLTLEPGGTVTEAPVAALAPADAGMTATFTLDSGKAEKLAVGAALTLRRKSPVAKEWSAPQPVYLGRSGYSDLAELPDGSLGILFEGGRKSDMGGIGFVRMPKGGF